MSKIVLAIDDDPDILSATETILQENGFSPLIAHNGDDALQYTQKTAAPRRCSRHSYAASTVALNFIMRTENG